MIDETQIFKELAFVYIVNGHKFLDKKDADKYVKIIKDIKKGRAK